MSGVWCLWWLTRKIIGNWFVIVGDLNCMFIGAESCRILFVPCFCPVWANRLLCALKIRGIWRQKFLWYFNHKNSNRFPQFYYLFTLTLPHYNVPTFNGLQYGGPFQLINRSAVNRYKMQRVHFTIIRSFEKQLFPRLLCEWNCTADSVPSVSLYVQSEQLEEFHCENRNRINNNKKTK